MQPSLISRSYIGRLFFFLFGGSLLTAGAASWVCSIWFLSAAMALLEGFTWARILSVFLPEDLPGIAITIGVMWGVAVFAIDASFVTLDTAPAYRKAREADPVGSGSSGWKMWFRNRLLMGTLLRIAIVSFSMALTGPFLAQTLDERKVVHAIDAQNAQMVAAHVAQAARAADERIATLEANARAARNELVRETAGKSVSGRQGCGATCRAMQENIARLEADTARAKAEKADRLQRLAQMSPQQLEKGEGVRLLHDNADTRNRIRKQLELESGQTLFGLPASHVLSSALFLLLFIAMVLLKIYQPRTVAIYYNEHLQEAFDRYRRGGFADLPVTILPLNDRHDGPSPMAAQRFDTWYHEVYLADCEARDLYDRMTTVEGSKKTAEQRRQGTEERLVDLRANQWELEAQHRLVGSQISHLEDRIMQQDHIIAATRHTLLSEQRQQLEAERLALHDRLDALQAAAIENGDKLEEVSNGIRTTEARMGILGSDNRRHARTIANPELQLLYEGHADLLEEKYRIDKDVKLARNALEPIEEALVRLEAALVPGAEFHPGDVQFADPALQRLIEEGRALKKERDDAVGARLQLEAKMAMIEEWITELSSQAKADATHVAEFMSRIREMEVQASAASAKRAA